MARLWAPAAVAVSLFGTPVLGWGSEPVPPARPASPAVPPAAAPAPVPLSGHAPLRPAGGIPAAAAPPAFPFADVGDAPPRTYVNLRLGAATSGLSGRMEICGEVAPLAFLSIEGCGTGSEALHGDDDPHVTHFQAKLRVAAWRTRLAWLETRLGAGFAEMQVAPDTAGFRFFDAGPDGAATAGAEGSAHLRASVPAVGGIELLMELRLSMAWLPHAPDLVDPKRVVQPTAGLTAGFGF